MRLLFAINNLCAGGGEKVLSSLINEISMKFNHDVRLVCFHSGDKFAYFYHIKEIIPIYLIEFGNIEQLTSVISAIKPEVIISFLNPMNYLCSIAAHATMVRHIACERNNPYKSPYRDKDRVMRDEAFETASGCIFQTKEAANYFEKKISGAFTIIDNPVCLRIYENPPINESFNRDKKIVTVGRYAEQKNYFFLIRIFRMFRDLHPDFILECFGKDSGQYSKVQQYVVDLRLENCVFLYKETPFVHNCIRNASAFLFTPTHEGTPNALLEAAALGIPCVASDLPEIKRINQKHPFAVLCSLNDPNEFVEKLERVIFDEEFAAKLKQNGQKMAKSRDIKTITKKWVDFIEDIINTPSN